MLLKTHHDAIDKVRNNPDVREVIDLYRKVWVDNSDDIKNILEFTASQTFGKRFGFESYAVSKVIRVIGKAYKDVKGRSHRTTNITTGKNPFIDFVIELFQREGLDPPKEYRIRQAIKKSK